MVSGSAILVGKHILSRIASKPTFLFMEKLVSDSAIFVGKHLQTRITAKPTFLIMEHTISWSVVLQFLWENIVKEESIENPRVYTWSMLEVDQ